MQMSYLYASDFPFKNFRKLTAQRAETIRKNVWEKSNDAYLLSRSMRSDVLCNAFFQLALFLRSE